MEAESRDMGLAQKSSPVFSFLYFIAKKANFSFRAKPNIHQAHVLQSVAFYTLQLQRSLRLRGCFHVNGGQSRAKQDSELLILFSKPPNIPRFV